MPNIANVIANLDDKNQQKDNKTAGSHREELPIKSPRGNDDKKKVPDLKKLL